MSSEVAAKQIARSKRAHDRRLRVDVYRVCCTGTRLGDPRRIREG